MKTAAVAVAHTETAAATATVATVEKSNNVIIKGVALSQ